MFSRKDTQFLLDLPKEWSESITELLNTNYANYLTQSGKTFMVWGKLYHGELVVIASLLNPSMETDIPTTYFVSIDLSDGQDHTKYLDNLVDSIGDFYEIFFSDPNWMDYLDHWVEEDYKGVNLFYKTNRENIALSIKAEQLLNQ